MAPLVNFCNKVHSFLMIKIDQRCKMKGNTVIDVTSSISLDWQFKNSVFKYIQVVSP